MKALELTGQRFGAMTVLRRVGSHACVTLQPYGEPTLSSFSAWLCRCDCGREKVVIGTNLKSGKTKSCGCQIWRMTHESKT